MQTSVQTSPSADPGRTRVRLAVLLIGSALAIGAGPARAQYAQGPGGPVQVVGDTVPNSLTGEKGDAARGRAIVANRQVGLCLLCHSGPFPEERFQGDIAPDLKGAGSRNSEGQLRLRMVDSGRINPATIMPAYFKIEGLNRVAAQFRGKPVLNAEQIEDVVAYLQTLRD